MERLRVSFPQARRSTTDPLEPGAPPVRRTAWVEEAVNPERDALLLHMDRLFTRWFDPQRAGIRAVLDGATYDEVGRAAGVSSQAVQARLEAADLSLYLVGRAALENAWSTP